MEIPVSEGLLIVAAGELVPGFVVYGLGAPGCVSTDVPALVDELWVGSGPGVKLFRLHGEGWEVVLWEIRVSRWPVGPQWERTQATLFDAMISRGADVAWIGDGFRFSDPPWLFDPEYMSGGVLAWRASNGQQGGHLDPTTSTVPISDEEMLRVRHLAAGLADAGQS